MIRPPPISPLFPPPPLSRPPSPSSEPASAWASGDRAPPSTYWPRPTSPVIAGNDRGRPRAWRRSGKTRSEEHTSELQSHLNLVCRLLLEKKKKYSTKTIIAV